MPASEKILEAQIQTEIVKKLRHLGYLVYSTPNEAAGVNVIRQGQMVALGLLAGVADLTVWLGNGRIAYLEVKAEKGKQSDAQKCFEERCLKNGYPYFVVRSTEEALNAINAINAQKTLVTGSVV